MEELTDKQLPLADVLALLAARSAPLSADVTLTCPSCGASELVQTGVCKTCAACGSPLGGCS